MAGRLATLRTTPLLHTLIKSRSFAAAAAIQYEDDYDYYGDRTARGVRHYNNNPMVDGASSEPNRGAQWVVMGEPGSKKHVYAQKLAKLLAVPHISMPSLLLQQLHPHSSLYKQIETAVSKGKLVPEDVISGLLSKRLEEGYAKGETGFILDGIPRTRTQAEIVDQIVDIDLVLNFKSHSRSFLDRNLVNGLSLQAHATQIKPFSEEAAWKEKLHTYAEQGKPLEDYYRMQNKLLDFQVAEGLGDTWRGLLSVLQLQHMNSDSQKLTA